MSTKKNGAGISATDQLYKRYGMKIDDYCRETINPQLRNLKGEALIAATLVRWRGFALLVKWLGGIFAYVDRYYCQALSLMPLSEVAYNSFRLLVLEGLHSDIFATVNSIITSHREGVETPQREIDTVQAICKMYADISGGEKTTAYNRSLEEPFVTDSKKYYTSFLSKHPSGSEDFQTQVKEILARESALAKTFLLPRTEQVLMKAAYWVLLKESYPGV
eukprot:TRINITY_DN23048_c0_g1_i1.p1 TRINITY_DN23048_c0_g1~~TRINITY_DN23048_c0_g1_i1.p1  ORF type:complete len:247 (-),score=25.55 TRINITY_DN23048_c0_g1_i1:19-678(-)